MPGYVALDVNPRTADVVANAMHLPLRSGAVSSLRAVDVLEHLSYRDTPHALTEWARVCAAGADFYVQVPDAHTIMEWYVRDADRLHHADGGVCDALYGAQWRLLGGHLDGRYCKPGDDFRWNAHYSLWSRRTLRIALNAAGFDVTELRTNEHPNILCRAWRR